LNFGVVIIEKSLNEDRLNPSESTIRIRSLFNPFRLDIFFDKYWRLLTSFLIWRKLYGVIGLTATSPWIVGKRWNWNRIGAEDFGWQV